MRATGVLVRFLSLLDVFLVLLGMLMLTLMSAQLRTPVKKGQPATGGTAELADVDFIYLYAGWKGAESGKCFLVGPNREVGREVRTDSPDDLRQIVATRSAGKERKNPVVLLLFSDDGWYSAWDAKRLSAVEDVWKVKVVPVYNVKLSR